MISFNIRSSIGGVFGRSSYWFLSFFFFFAGAAFFSSCYWGSPLYYFSTPQPTGFFCNAMPSWYKTIGKISFAFNNEPFEKSLNSPSLKWTVWDLFSGFDGTWLSKAFCFKMTF